MSRLKKYVNSIDFLTSDIMTESALIENINKKYLKEIKLYKKNIFIQIEDLDFILLKKNNIIFYPYNIKFIFSKGSKIKIPIFLENPSLLIILLDLKKIKFKSITINDVKTDLIEKEREYYYQENFFINLLNRSYLFSNFL